MTGRRGFTLLELIVALALAVAILVVISGAFAAGLRVYDRAKQLGGTYGDSVIAQESLQQDLRNTDPSRLTSFRGAASWIEIPSMVRREEPQGFVVCPGVVRYGQGSSAGTLERVTTLFVPGGAAEVTREILASSLAEVAFSFGEEEGGHVGRILWRNTWGSRTNLPIAVKVVIRINQDGEQRELSRTVVLPRQ
jgi:prepilin-type N-terminal cleavage/methylation domain-containing protein